VPRHSSPEGGGKEYKLLSREKMTSILLSFATRREGYNYVFSRKREKRDTKEGRHLPWGKGRSILILREGGLEEKRRSVITD